MQKLLSACLFLSATVAAAYPTLETTAVNGGTMLAGAQQDTQKQDKKNQAPTPDAVVEMNVDVEALRVTVLDTHGRLLNLGPKNFRVYEWGNNKGRQDWVLQQYPIPLFDKDEQPLTLGLLIDNSGSMRIKKLDDNGEHVSRKNLVLKALKTLYGTLKPEDQIFPISFNDKIEMYSVNPDLNGDGSKTVSKYGLSTPECQDPKDSDEEENTHPFVTSSEELQDFLENYEPDGKTVMYDAVHASVSYADHYSTPYKAPHSDCKPRKKALLLVTDGEDHGSRATLEQAAKIAKDHHVAVYAIGLPDEDSLSHRDDEKALRNLTEKTGGIALFPDSTSESKLEKACIQIAEAMRTQYKLGYYPINGDGSHKPADGTERTVKVEARDSSGNRLEISVADTYVANKN